MNGSFAFLSRILAAQRLLKSTSPVHVILTETLFLILESVSNPGKFGGSQKLEKLRPSLVNPSQLLKDHWLNNWSWKFNVKVPIVVYEPCRALHFRQFFLYVFIFVLF